MDGFRVQMQVGKIGGDGIIETVAALVDDGVTFATLPASMLQRLGIKPDEPRLFRIASGEIVEYMTGDAFFRAEGTQQRLQGGFRAGKSLRYGDDDAGLAPARSGSGAATVG